MSCSTQCEKQIIVPNTSILYCSEKCRKQDTRRPTSINLTPSSCSPYSYTWTTPPLGSPHMNQTSYFEGAPMKNYVTPSSPTPPRSTPFFGDEMVPIPPVGDSALATVSGPRSTLQRSHSTGHSSGYSPTDSTPSSPISSYSNIYSPPRGRGHQLRAVTCTSGHSNPNTPGSPYGNAYPRPLPLHRPHSTYAASSKSIDLVTPINTDPEPVPTTITLPTSPASPTCTELLHESSWVIPKTKTEGLKTMFNFEKIRAGASPPITPAGLGRVTGTGLYHFNNYGVYRSTQMPIKEDSCAYIQGITTVLRN